MSELVPFSEIDQSYKRRIDPEVMAVFLDVMAAPDGLAVKIHIPGAHRARVFSRRVYNVARKQGIRLTSRTDGLGYLYLMKVAERVTTDAL